MRMRTHCVALLSLLAKPSHPAWGLCSLQAVSPFSCVLSCY